jgi:2-(1,2-epoxy-1,2-dihydrophenyl)acetyl-CoA isomerase
VDSAVAEAVRAVVADSVLEITLARPEKANALRNEDCGAVVDALKQADGGGPVRVVLIRSEGKHFCVGADLVAANDDGQKPTVGHLARGLETGPHRMIDAVWNCPVPTVSAVHGGAMGLGLHLAVACDFTLAADDSLFAEPFCQRGFSVDSGGSFLLPRLIGVRRARQMLYRGTTVDAATAAEWGLVDEVLPTEGLEAAAAELATELAAGPTFSLGHTKNLLNRRAPETLEAALAAEAMSVEATVRSADFKEGIRAFMERRDPVFTGH